MAIFCFLWEQTWAVRGFVVLVSLLLQLTPSLPFFPWLGKGSLKSLVPGSQNDSHFQEQPWQHRASFCGHLVSRQQLEVRDSFKNNRRWYYFTVKNSSYFLLKKFLCSQVSITCLKCTSVQFYVSPCSVGSSSTLNPSPFLENFQNISWRCNCNEGKFLKLSFSFSFF